MGLIMRPKETCVGSSKDMEIAFQNILNEIIEHVIEGICFEAHRAVKLGYFPVKEYNIKERKFELPEPRPLEPECIIFANEKEIIYSVCPKCNQAKDAKTLVRHMRNCRSKPNEKSAKTESCEIEVDGMNSDGKKGNGAKRPAKSLKLTTIYDGHLKIIEENIL